jgi:hypothetical protein
LFAQPVVADAGNHWLEASLVSDPFAHGALHRGFVPLCTAAPGHNLLVLRNTQVSKRCR